jgi:hypothetical protein
MDILTISTIVAPTIVIIVHFRYAKSVDNIKELIRKTSRETESIEERLLADSQLERQKVEDSMKEIDELRKEIEILHKEKAAEVGLRNDLEKKVQLVLQENEHAKKITNAINIAQKEAFEKSQNIMQEIADNLFEKLTNHDFEESEEVEDFEENEDMAQNKKAEEYNFDKEQELSEIAESFKEDNKDLGEEIEEEFEDEVEEEFEDEEFEDEEIEELEDEDGDNDDINEEEDLDEDLEEDEEAHIVDKFVLGLIDLIEVDGGKVNQDYFVAHEIAEEKAESFECEIAFIKNETLYGVDVKSCLIFDEYNASENQDENILLNELSGYIDYVSDKKYVQSILQSLPSEAKYQNHKIILALNNNAQIEMLKEFGFEEKLNKANILLKSFKEINDIIL